MKMFKFGSKKDINTDYKCTIRLLDDTEVFQCDFKCEHKGQFLLDFVCNALNLLETDYFGLRYVDTHSQRHWLDTTRSILKQVKGLSPIVFCFRVKFYPAEPHRLKEEITRYQVFLQLRRDLLHGRLYCSQNDAALLAAYIIQSELGDHDADEHPLNYVSDFKLLLKQTPRLEEKVAEIHQTQLRGQVPAVAEINFLRKACLLDTYGVDPHPVKDHKGNQMYLGINHVGILTFQGSRKTHHFKWPDIQKINYEGKMFIVHLLFNEDSRTKKKHLIGFKCPTHAACHHLWKCAVEQKYYFTMNSSSEVPQVTTGGGLFSRGCKFRYSGRVDKEVSEDTKLIKRDQPTFQRVLARPPSFRSKATDNFPNSQLVSPNEITEDYSSSQNVNNHSLSNACNAVIEYPDIPDGDSIRSPTASSLRKDVLEPLDEETKETVVSSDSFPFTVNSLEREEDTRHPNSSNKTSCNADTIANQKGDHQESEDSGSASVHSEDENSEPSYPAIKALQLSSSRCIDEFLPPEMKIPKRRTPISISPPLPPHVNIMRGLVLASLFVLLLLSCLLVVVMESDSSLFGDIRKFPEMIMLRREYYEPVKDYFVKRMMHLFKR